MKLVLATLLFSATFALSLKGRAEPLQSCGIERPTKASDVLSYDAADRFQNINGSCLHWVQAGTGKKGIFILLHGVPQFWYAWRKVIPELVHQDYGVVAPDLRGFNLSGCSKNKNDYRLENYAQDISELIRTIRSENPDLKREQIVVVGHDFGAFVTWYLAAYHSDIFGGAIVVNGPHPKLWREAVVRNIDREQFAMSWYAFAFAGLPKFTNFFLTGAYGLFEGVKRNLRSHMIKSSLTGASPGSIDERDIEIYAAAIADDLSTMTKPYEAMTLPGGILESRKVKFLTALSSATSYLVRDYSLGLLDHGYLPISTNRQQKEVPLSFGRAKVPLRVVYGKYDGYLKENIFGDADKLLPLIDPSVRSSFDVISVLGSSHWLPEDAPVFVVREALRLMSDIEGRP